MGQQSAPKSDMTMQLRVVKQMRQCFSRSWSSLPCRQPPQATEYINNLQFVVYFLLGNSPASGVYMPTFRNTLSVPSSQAGRCEWNYPKESIQHTEHGESLISRKPTVCCLVVELNKYFEKGKVHPRTGHYGAAGEQMYNSTLSLTLAVNGVGGQRQAPAALPRGKRPCTRRLGGPQVWSGRVRKISPPPVFDPRTVQLAASRYSE